MLVIFQGRLLIITAAFIISGLLGVSTELLTWISLAGCLFIALLGAAYTLREILG